MLYHSFPHSDNNVTSISDSSVFHPHDQLSCHSHNNTPTHTYIQPPTNMHTRSHTHTWLTTSISVFECPMLQTIQPFFIRSKYSLTTTFLFPEVEGPSLNVPSILHSHNHHVHWNVREIHKWTEVNATNNSRRADTCWMTLLTPSKGIMLLYMLHKSC